LVFGFGGFAEQIDLILPRERGEQRLLLGLALA
jgi:hypothetical protein